MTAHKAQGLTLPTVMVDLASCIGTESPYVMVSRAKSLDGLLIAGHFEIDVIQKHRKQDVRIEMRRQRVLELLTLV
ncbi:hypothetical protein C8J56DRAFT_757745, partial [Mycena floridula]